MATSTMASNIIYQATPKPQAKSKTKTKSKFLRTDLSIQGTNDSSIVSKRSVERIYWSDSAIIKAGFHPDLTETHRKPTEWFRFFVHKPVRRSPIINRGYWVRMYAMNRVTKALIQQQPLGSTSVVVVNLGCGFDPYPYQFLESESSLVSERNVQFLDIDYPDLIRRKVDIIRATGEIRAVIGGDGHISYEPVTEKDLTKEKEYAKTSPRYASGFQLKSPRYACLGCDLRDLDTLKTLLDSQYGLTKTTFLFTAEVSLTYMDNTSADKLIEWASGLPQAHFVLLEQIVPAGKTHPFAQTMLNHFDSLGTSLGSIHQYQTCLDQIRRFETRNWPSVDATDLCRYWHSHVPQTHKRYLNYTEDFDELEEFVLFGQHYVVLQASNISKVSFGTASKLSEPSPDYASSVGAVLTLNPLGSGALTAKRKFFACGNLDEHSILISGGISTVREPNSLLLTTKINSGNEFCEVPDKLDGRAAHALTKLHDGLVLTGGRHSPSQPRNTILRYDYALGRWLHSSMTLVQDRGVYRHCTVALNDTELLVFGGLSGSSNTKSDSAWQLIGPDGTKILKSDIGGRSGSVLVWDRSTNKGYLIGGQDSDVQQCGLIRSDLHEIRVENDCVVAKKLMDHPLLCRYGADAVITPQGSLLIAGGVSSGHLYTNDDFFVSYSPESHKLVTHHSEILPIPVGFKLGYIDGNLVFIGGGAVCFSFGSYWNDTFIVLDHTTAVDSTLQLQLLQPQKRAKFIQELVPRSIQHASEFAEVYSNYVPVLFVPQDLGKCLTLWKDPRYLIEKIGADRKVVAHVSEDSRLNFQAKNFQYSTMKFQEFINLMFGSTTATKTTNVYLRSLSSQDPRNKPAMFEYDFSEIADDFQLPPAFGHAQKHCFSSPLRLSAANTSIWLHYDVTANILCQITGTKRVRLYPPSDVQHLYFPVGSSSSTIKDIFHHDDPQTHPIDVTMQPGSIIYIPPMWLHAVKCLEPSISLNFFWKDLPEDAYAKGRDVYGNQDLAAYEQGRKQIAKLAESFEGLPSDIKTFYLLKLADEIKNNVV